MPPSPSSPNPIEKGEEDTPDISTTPDIQSTSQPQPQMQMQTQTQKHTQQDTRPTPQQAQRIASLEAKIASLKHQIHETESKHNSITAQLKSPNQSPSDTVRQHIARLHNYNEIRDVGQGLMGLIADQRGVRIRDVYREFGVVEGD